MKEPPQAERYVKDGITHATRALELDPSNAEALAIKVALQGMSIRFEPSLAMSLGPELESSMGRALGMAPKNPRVHFIDALNTLHKPEFVGGGARQGPAQVRRDDRALRRGKRRRQHRPALGSLRTRCCGPDRAP